MNMTLTVNA